MATAKRVNRKTGAVSYAPSAGGSSSKSNSSSASSSSLGSVYTPPASPESAGLTPEQRTNEQIAQADRFGVAPTAPTPAVPTATVPSVESPYYSRVTKSQVQQEPPLQAQSVEQIQRQKTRSAQGEIDALNRHYEGLLGEQNIINEGASRGTQAVNTLTGLGGSSEANVATAKTDKTNMAANEKIMNQKAVAIQTILSDIRSSAVIEAREQRNEARLDATAAAEAQVARQEAAAAQLVNLTAAGVTFDGLKNSDPEGFAYLSEKLGGDDALKGAFILNTPQDAILDKKIENGKYIVATQNPLTGKISVQTLDLGLPPNYSNTIDAGDRILAVPDGWDGDTSKLISINKGRTPAQQAAAGAAGAGGEYGSDLDALIGATLSSIPTKFGQGTFQSQIAKARNDSDKINLIATQVLRGQPAELRSDFANQAVGIANIDKAIALIDSGVKTGVVNDKIQYAYNIVGKDFDPKLAQVNSYITAAIQPYRNSVTGAAWGNQEDGEYASLFGSTKYYPAELKQRLTTLKEVLKNKSAVGLNTFVNPMGYYDNAFESGQFAPDKGDVRSRAEAAGYDYEAMKNDGLSDEEIASSL
jgi:hypothetical protein